MSAPSDTPQWRKWRRTPGLVGLGGFSAAALLLGVLIVAVRVRWVPLESVDRGVAADLNRVVADRGALVSVLRMVTVLGSIGVLGWLVAISTLILLVRKRWRLAGYLLVTGAGALILDPALKIAVGRLRPVGADPVALGGGSSFPSGHALASVIGYGALLLVFTPALPRRARTPVIIALAVVVVLVGFSRLALGVHYLSDVLGAWCLGGAWLGATAYAFEVWRRGSGKRVTDPLSEGLEPEASADLKPTGPATGVATTGRVRAVAGSGVAWVLVFGVLCAIGVSLARYRNGNGNILGDLTIPHWLAAHRTSGFNEVSQWGSTAGNTHAILFVGLIAGAIALAAIRRWRPVIFLVATMFGELTLFLASAAVTGRQRPDVSQLDGQLPTSSFPSGHIAATICLYAAIAVLVMPRTRAWWRWLFIAVAVLMPLWVASSRVYRGMHHPTDALGSVVLAACWLTAMVLFVRPNRDLDARATTTAAAAAAGTEPTPDSKVRAGMRVDEWFLSAAERGNPHSGLDRRRGDGLAWTIGNAVRPLIDGGAYYAALLPAIRAMNAGDLLMFTDWRGDPDERLDGPGSEISRVLCQAARRGVIVKGLIWRSHADRFRFSSSENDHLGDEIEAAGGECLRDMRVRTGGSHHQKFVVLRHPGRPHLDVAYVGGIDLCHGRHDDATHDGDPQPLPIAAAYGKRPPWHDIQAAIQGPAVGEVEATFRERWNDPSLLSRNPLHRIRDLIAREDTTADPLPAQLADPPARGTLAVQLLRTYPYRRHGYPFAPLGERSVARGYNKAVARARTLIYLEDQYLWSPLVITCFADALRDNPRLHLIAVLPRYPDQDGRLAATPQLFGRARAMLMLQRAGGDRVAVYSPENRAGVPIYVHAKVCVIDDEWASIGSDNMSRRSWTHDSELSCAVLDASGTYARDLRLRLAREHLQLTDDAPLRDPAAAFAVFAAAATALQRWQCGDRQGERPPGRLLPYHAPDLSRWTQAWSGVLYRTICDPDGRPRALRRGNTF